VYDDKSFLGNPYEHLWLMNFSNKTINEILLYEFIYVQIFLSTMRRNGLFLPHFPLLVCNIMYLSQAFSKRFVRLKLNLVTVNS
jgi:hypothetical protein